MIEVKNLVKKYGDHVAVDHLSFTVEEGHIYGFLGPNGAGKSTTMNMITGYIGPTEGSIMINGHDMLENPEEAKKCIGYLPEIPPLYTDMTPLEYLRFAAELKGIAKNKRKEEVEKVIADARLEDMKDRLIRNLSKGYKQRVGLAQALLGYPEVIILDEPTVGLDPAQIIEMRGLIRSLGKKHTVILSSHILSEISAVCDDVLILSHGKLVASDTTDNVLILSHGKLVASDTTDNLGKLMEDKVTLHLTVKGDEETIKGALDSVEGVENIEYKESDEKDCVDVMIQSDPKTEIRDMIFYRLAAVQCPTYAMNQIKKSLEDVFMELTADSTTDAADQNAAAAEDIRAKAGEYIAAADDEKTETEATAENGSNTDNGEEAAEHGSDL